jgi:hypothetical protein
MASNEKCEYLRGTHVSRMGVLKTRTEYTQNRMKTKMDIHQGKMEAAIHSIRPVLEETIKHRVEDMSCVDQNRQGLRK